MNQTTRSGRAAAILLILVLLLTALPAAALAQAAPTVVSPEVAADGTVTFRYVGDATVTRVQVMGEWSKDPTGTYFCAQPAWPTPDMTQDANGVWTYSVKLEPNYYNYRFYVWHGDTRANVPDPLNPPWEPTGINSQVFVPGPGVEWLGPQNVPHGKLQVVWYYSAAAQTQRRMTIYTPPGYERGRFSYPTLYLSHGGGGNDVDWSTQGAANNILDNLIAAGQTRPMVVVMTNFNGIPGGTDGFRLDLINSLIPAVESQYRVSKDPRQRVYAGLSAGASRGQNILFNSPEAFGVFGLWSGGKSIPSDTLYADPDFLAVRGIHIRCGLSDNPSQAQVDSLVAHGMRVDAKFIPGCHTWYVWRDALRDLLTTLPR